MERWSAWVGSAAERGGVQKCFLYLKPEASSLQNFSNWYSRLGLIVKYLGSSISNPITAHWIFGYEL